jgi:hypothetical protein
VNYWFRIANLKFQTISDSYHIVITRKKQILLSFLHIRIIVNGNQIYPVKQGERLVITVEENNPKIVVTDGFHFTQPLELVFHHLHTYYFKIICAIDNTQLLAGFGVIIFLNLVGFVTGIFIIKLVSLFPILYFLFLYYINRKDFIQIQAV